MGENKKYIRVKLKEDWATLSKQGEIFSAVERILQNYANIESYNPGGKIINCIRKYSLSITDEEKNKIKSGLKFINKSGAIEKIIFED